LVNSDVHSAMKFLALLIVMAAAMVLPVEAVTRPGEDAGTSPEPVVLHLEEPGPGTGEAFSAPEPHAALLAGLGGLVLLCFVLRRR